MTSTTDSSNDPTKAAAAPAEATPSVEPKRAVEPESQVLDLNRSELELMMRGLLHEMRNPLSSIITAATLLEDAEVPAKDANGLDEETQMLLGVVKKESLRLNHIMTEFANFIKVTTPDPKAFDLVKTFQSTIGELQREKVLSPQVEIDNQLPESCLVWADENQIHNALRHLLHNAGEALKDGGCLSLWQLRGESPDSVVFCLRDSGSGFTADSRERAFQPFYSTKAHNLGLGLSAARAIFEAASGRLCLDDYPVANKRSADAGTERTGVATVCFSLPRAT